MHSTSSELPPVTLDAQLREEIARREQAETEAASYRQTLRKLSHELRNPLGAIAAAAEVIRTGSGGDAMKERALAIIERQTRHMAQTVADLLEQK